MEIKHASSILLGNMSYVAKLFVWLLICVLLTAAIAAAIFIPVGNALDMKGDIVTELTLIKDSIHSLLKNETGVYDLLITFEKSALAILGMLASNAGVMAGLVIAVIFLYCLYLFLTGLSYYPTAYIINALMSSNTRYGFAASMAKNIKMACKFSVSRMLMSCPIDLSIVALLAGVGFGLMKLIGVFALPILLVAGLALFSLRSILFSGWLPRLLHNPEERTFDAFVRSLVSVKGNMGALFKSFSLIFFVAYCCVFVLTVPTFGFINILIPSTYYILLRSVELVGFYKTNNMSFYVDSRTVINTVEYGYRKDNQEDDDEYNDINY
jgi:hypothetical protein